MANFFVTKSSLTSLTDALTKYEEWENDEFADVLGEDEDARRPTNFKLFESAALIRPAKLRDYWTDNIDGFPRRKEPVKWKCGQETTTKVPSIGRWQNWVLSAGATLRSSLRRRSETFSATPEDMQTLIRRSGAVVELRNASSFVSDYMKRSPGGQQELISSLARRITPAPPSAPRVTVLDTGGKRGQPSAVDVSPERPMLLSQRQLAYIGPQRPWNKDGWRGAFPRSRPSASCSGTTSSRNSSGIGGSHCPSGLQDVPAHDAINKAVQLVESEDVARVYCLAQTAVGEPEDGRPSSTSAALDKLAYRDGVSSRLFCVAVGNVDCSDDEPYQVADYVDRNRRHGIQSPAQALNALSIGAFTDKANGSALLVASRGDLSPTSRTSQEWLVRGARKPDIVMEGGNHEIDEDEIFSSPSPSNLVLTTSRDVPSNPLAMTGQTSAGTAAAAHLAARFMARYPGLRMETIRGMLVHSAEWTPAMWDQLKELKSSHLTSDPWATMLSRYGWGTPNEERLFASTESDMTLIIEDSLEPYEIGDSNQVRSRR